MKTFIACATAISATAFAQSEIPTPAKTSESPANVTIPQTESQPKGAQPPLFRSATQVLP